MTRTRRIVSAGSYGATKNIGGLVFEQGGEFILSNLDMQARVSRTIKNIRHFVYAHIVSGQVMYIGESSDTFQSRMRFYITHPGSTNVRVKASHLPSLHAGNIVEIYYHKPPVIDYCGLSINPYISIEQALIHNLKPPLNEKDVLA